MEAHLVQHTAQAENTRAAVEDAGFAASAEARQLIRKVYQALAAVEAAGLGAPDLGLAERMVLAEKIAARTAEVQQVLEQVGRLQVAAGDVATVQALTKANKDLADATAPSGRSLLLEAVFQGQPEVVAALKGVGAEYDIFVATALGDMNGLEAACSKWPDDISEIDGHGMTPLHLAAYFGQESAVAWLLEKGSDAKARDASGRTPRDLAEEQGQETVTVLLADN